MSGILSLEPNRGLLYTMTLGLTLRAVCHEKLASIPVSFVW